MSQISFDPRILDPNKPHPFIETHLNTACGRCARKRRHIIHTSR